MNGALKSNDDGKTYNVLVVDDDPATRRMVTSYFEEHAVSASSAAGRQDLTRHLAEAEPSLIILDLRLGREDGLDLLREIRSNSDVPVIITTGPVHHGYRVWIPGHRAWRHHHRVWIPGHYVWR